MHAMIQRKRRQTCKRLEIKVREYLLEVLPRLAYRKTRLEVSGLREFAELTPGAWLKTRTAQNRRSAYLASERPMAPGWGLGEWTRKPTEKGTPQGATLSPLLANIYLQYVPDLWIHQWRRKYANGEVIVVRFADHFLVGFQHKEDAERMLTLIREPMAQFALELHSKKTRLIEFGRFAAKKRSRRNRGRPVTFDFLGFTHICGENRKGGFILMRHSVNKRVQQKRRAVPVELRKRMHRPIAEKGRWLGPVFRGFSQYHAVPTNGRAVNSFQGELSKSW
jgi:RNA-directed DNA polymerase